MSVIDVVYINKYCKIYTRTTVLEASTSQIDHAPAWVRIKLPSYCKGSHRGGDPSLRRWMAHAWRASSPAVHDYFC